MMTSEADRWKNLQLCQEMQISGRFIYNGLRCFHEIHSFQHQEEVFEVLYNLAVGIERLLKVAVILIEHPSVDDQKHFERSLITHSHQDLMRRVRSTKEVKMSSVHNDLLAMLGEFYKTNRYSRFCINQSQQSEQEMLFCFFQKHLEVEVHGGMFPSYNEDRFRRFLGRTVGKVVRQLYTVVFESGSFTHELRYHSKAAKVFLSDEYDFFSEDVLWKELLLFLSNSPPCDRLKALKRLTPLEFDPALDLEMMQCFKSHERKLELMDELECLYEEVKDRKLRLDLLAAIDSPSADFSGDEEE